VAIAVALANAPQLVLADEPTGELDTASSQEVFEALRAANRELGATVVVVTHDPTVSGQVERTVAIRDGRTSSEVLRRTEVGVDGDHAVIAEEFAVMDRAGRVQIPADYREALELTRRVRLALETDAVSVRPDAAAR
jgi:ABC-type glutathione transport system ATPase component